MRRRFRRLGARARSYLKLFTISPAEWRHLVRAQFSLLHARFLLSTRETGGLVSPHEGEPAPSDPDRLPHARALALAVRRASAFGVIRPTCLVQSMALVTLLDRDGLPGGRIRIGVRDRLGKVEAHAWVEYGGEVIGDFGEHVATFTELTDVRLVERSDR
ncbi:MAG TPA: lasso peptide biosynthesis B2 protein [Gemmatimonadaceae bacterium]|nr:lasso peptide biosynthesis B2 protein [Gemmatimonadaceae bacterium]